MILEVIWGSGFLLASVALCGFAFYWEASFDENGFSNFGSCLILSMAAFALAMSVMWEVIGAPLFRVVSELIPQHGTKIHDVTVWVVVVMAGCVVYCGLAALGSRLNSAFGRLRARSSGLTTVGSRR